MDEAGVESELKKKSRATSRWTTAACIEPYGQVKSASAVAAAAAVAVATLGSFPECSRMTRRKGCQHNGVTATESAKEES